MTGQRNDIDEQLDDTNDSDATPRECRVIGVPIMINGRRKFVAVCQGCGERSDVLSTMGMVWGWETRHREATGR